MVAFTHSRSISSCNRSNIKHQVQCVSSDTYCNTSPQSVYHKTLNFYLPAEIQMTMKDVMWCDVMWCDMMWCGVMWCDVMWCDVIWCDVVWCDATWRDVTRRDEIRRDRWHDMTWHDIPLPITRISFQSNGFNRFLSLKSCMHGICLTIVDVFAHNIDTNVNEYIHIYIYICNKTHYKPNC